MDNRLIIQRSIDYIEQNLKNEIIVQELSEIAGFSIFHYYRMFQSAVGMPVMQYIVKRKLLNAIYDISQGDKMIDTVLRYGFDTHAGFYKAFKREIGYTPSYFLKKYKVKKPYKINLFKEEHIMVTHKKIREILKSWEIQNEPIKDIYYESSGNHNENAYYVGEDYVIKFAVNLGNLKKHVELSKAIENVGLFAATVVKTKDDREYIEDGELYFYLTKRLEGSQITAGNMYEGDYTSKARFVGEIIGQLHLALQDVDALVDNVNLYENVINWAMPKAKKIMGLPDELCMNYIDVFGKLYDKLPKQIIHRDPNPGNIITNGSKWGFIDCELSERNLRIFDPCYASTAILSESFVENDNEILSKWIEIYKNIIYGYDSIVKLTVEERKSIPYVILSNQLVCIAWLSGQNKYEDIFKVNMKMTKWVVDNIDKLQI